MNYLKKIRLLSIASITTICASTASLAATVGLTGTSFTTQVQYQPSETAERQAISFEASSIVGDGVEFSNLADLEVESNPFGLFVVPVQLDVGDDFIELDYSDAGSGGFASGFFNGYLFQFDSGVPIAFQSASIDADVTNVGVSDDDLNFSGNQLFLNVASRSFNSSSIIRISAEAVPAAVPIPAAAPLLIMSLGSLAFLRTRRRRHA